MLRRLTSAASTGSASATSYKWKAKYGGLEVSDARRLKALEEENAKLKKLLAEAMLDNAMLKDVTSNDGNARRQARGRRSPAGCVRGKRATGVCGARGGSHLIPLSKPPAGRCPRACPPSRTGEVRRFGYRRLLVLMRRAGLTTNHKKVRRLYREERRTHPT